jgi:ABC-2 type transport system permease protein
MMSGPALPGPKGLGMISPVLLIAEREFRTYVATLSFWLSLALAPLAGVVALVFVPVDAPAVVTIAGGDTMLNRTTQSALQQAGQLEGRRFLFAAGGARLHLSFPSRNHIDLDFAPGFPLSNTGRALVSVVLERDAARRGAPALPLAVRASAASAASGMDGKRQAQLITMTALWLTLTGSLGMLLQAVVRERANRALESLLASAEGWEVVAGKILGVGAVSLLVLVSWGCTAALFSLGVHTGPLVEVAAILSDPVMLAGDIAIYVCAFAFYGALTVLLGSLAQDSASAQNLARPLFILLLLGFLAALARMSQASAVLSWLVWLPPFTPFMLLVGNAPGAFFTQALPLVMLALASVTTVAMAAGSLTIVPRPRGAWRLFRVSMSAEPNFRAGK